MGGETQGRKIYPPEELNKIEFDYVYVGVLTYYEEVMSRLRSMGIPEYKIVDKYVALPTKARIVFLENAYEMLEKKGYKKDVWLSLASIKGISQRR